MDQPMDEQRFGAYVALIEELLDCPQGRQAILAARRDLVDAGLLKAVEQYGAYLERQGKSQKVAMLRGLAAQLAQALGLGEESETAGAAGAEDAARFLLETLRLVQESQGNPQPIYSVWAQQQARFNEDFLAVLPAVVGQLFERVSEQRTVVAWVLVTFGNLINQFPLGSRGINLELGIAAYEQALLVYTRAAFSEDWAMTQHNLANAYSGRIQGDRAANLEQAIAAYEQALQVRTRDAFPQQWASTQHSLAAAYSARIKGDRAESLERAIAVSQLALQVYTRAAFPEQWAGTQNNLAIAYSHRIRGERADNLEQAIIAYEQALQIRTHNDFPEQWAETQNNLAATYRNRIRGEREKNLEQAIFTYKQALLVYTNYLFPEQWATIQNNLATAHLNRIRGERADNLEQAITAFQLALQVRTRNAFPEQWATTKNNLATTYSQRIRGQRVDNLERAIAAYKLACQVYTREAFPEQWAMTQHNLATTYKDRIRGERAYNLEAAINTYQLTLQVYTREAFPEQWAMTQHNLANAYAVRIRDERANNLEAAINASQLALQVYTREAFPEQWASTQNNLANAYSARIKGDRADSIERAISAYELALQVRTRKAFPEDCRQTARNLGNLHFDQQAWAKAANAYTTALAAAETLYQSCILLDGKAAELKETADLPRRAAYALARSGHLQTAVETLEQGRARGLSESMERDRADLTQLQQTAPHLYTQYQDITQQLRNLESQQRDRLVSSDRHSLTPEAQRNNAIDLRQRLDTLIAQIRQVEGYADFLDQPSFEDICAALQPNNPLIYLVHTPAGSLALIVTPDGITDLWLNDLTETSLRKLLQNWFNAYNQSQSDRQGWFDAIAHGTQQLWAPLMAPLIDHLKTHNFHQATLIPTGVLSLFPLHAAWTADPSQPSGKRYALDDIHFTYAPNARSLTAAQQIAQQVQSDQILAIDNPRQDLPNSAREVNRAIAHFPQPTVLRHTEATVDAVRSHLMDAAIVHFSCHGTADFDEPLNSGLLMSNGLLTLRDLFALKLTEGTAHGIRLAILSACETGLPGLDNIDEVISLPIGLLQAGVAGVIASLWSVSDLSTMLLLTRFYDLWRKDGLEPAIALRQAQQWLRDASPAAIVAHCATFIPDYPRPRSTTRTEAIAQTRLLPSLPLVSL
jgi:CHAT domain-containing protein